MIMNEGAAGPKCRMLAMQLVHSCLEYGYVYSKEDYLALKNGIEKHMYQLNEQGWSMDQQLWSVLEEVEADGS